jgi:hypothetical protein
VAPSSRCGRWVAEVGGRLYLDNVMDDPLGALFYPTVVYTRLDDALDHPLEMLSAAAAPSNDNDTTLGMLVG